jgi:hypothetical protein
VLPPEQSIREAIHKVAGCLWIWEHVSMTTENRLAPTYAQARDEVLAAAACAGAEVTSFPHPTAGREGEELAIDVATVGPEDAESVVVIVSGTHGVEGYCGSALQRWWLDERSATLAAGVRVVIVHALNPVGFSWVRRVNEDNVDLNRNFVDWSQPPPANDGYSQVADLLVPEEWSQESQAETTNALLEVAGTVGMERFQEIVTGGQYHHPDGIFHGGSEPVWSHRWAAEHLPEIVGAARRLCLLDLHTGLGPWGHGELISVDDTGSDPYERGTAWWGDVRSMSDGESVSADLSGDWLSAVPGWIPNTEATTIAIEYGTVDVITVLQSLRADAWLHAYGDPTSEAAAMIRAQVRAAFVDDDPAWLAAVITRFDDVCGAAISALSRT